MCRSLHGLQEILDDISKRLGKLEHKMYSDYVDDDNDDEETDFVLFESAVVEQLNALDDKMDRLEEHVAKISRLLFRLTDTLGKD